MWPVYHLSPVFFHSPVPLSGIPYSISMICRYRLILRRINQKTMPPRNPRLIIFIVALFAIAIGILISVSTTKDHAEDDKTQTIDRNGSLETALSVIHADSAHDVIITSYKVWVRDTAYATITHRDTVPALDSMATDAGNGNGDTRPIRVKRDYQFFITVK